jgi:alcohol dehydrogenase YqhD (iron-dependent ADH family)
MNDFIYDIPTKVYFGKDQLKNLGSELKKYGQRVLMVYGGGSIKRIGLYDKVMNEMK